MATAHFFWRKKAVLSSCRRDASPLECLVLLIRYILWQEGQYDTRCSGFAISTVARQIALFIFLIMDNTTTPLDAEIVPTEPNAPAMATHMAPPSSVTNGHTPPIGAQYGDGATPADTNASIVGKGDGKGGWTPGFRAKTSPERALKWARHFTESGHDPFDTVEWEMRTAGITGEDGKSVFEQTDCEIPKPWSQLATNVVVSKYFRGAIGSPQRETSVKQVIGRVADTIGSWGAQGGYFASDEDAKNFRDELAYLLVHQYGAFNSPVWFNLGVKGAKQQCSACFINDVYDDMESIMELAATEARLFKGGSGAGVNLWRIRSSREHLRGGGIASGPISFMRGWDSFAGAVKCLTPDAQVYTDSGVKTVGELISPDLAPGFHADDSVVLATNDGPTRISQVYVSPESPTRRMELAHTGLRLRGTHQHPVLTLTPQFELQWKALSQIAVGDRVAVARGQEMWPVEAPKFDFEPNLTRAKKDLTYPAQMTPELARLLGYMTSEGCMDAERFRFCNADKDVFADFLRCVEAVFGTDARRNVSERTHEKTGVTTQMFEACWASAVRFLQCAGLGFEHSGEKRVPHSIMASPRELVAEFLRAYFEGDGHVSTYVYASSASRELLSDVQLLLLNMGMLPLLRRHPVGGKDHWNLCLRGEAAFRFVREVGFISARKQAASDVAGDKNTNIDTVPFLVDVLRQYTAKNKYLTCSEGQTRELGFGVFNRKPGSAISYGRLRNTPALLDQLEQVNPQLAETLEWVMAREYFWDTAKSVEAAAPAVTYDFTVPRTHSFVANGIVNHNSGGTTRRAAKMVILNADHPDIGEFITCKADEEKKAWALIEAGYNGGFNVPGGAYDSVAFQNANHSVRVTDEFMRAAENNANWQLRAVTTGKVTQTVKAREMLKDIAQTTWICGDPGMQFDTIINDWHTCSNTDRIHASNPCSEFMFLNSTACNLASLNLLKFYDMETGDFDAEGYSQACETFLTAQEIIVSFASYPTEKIGEMSEQYRPLGLGYANLGALLMAKGLAYDSDEGRALAGALTAIMTGAGYRKSAQIARNTGAFAGYADNREPMLRVIAKHRDAVNQIDATLVAENVMQEARNVWDDAYMTGQKYGYRNSQATVLAPTGTISFMMDCDTTGVEPDIALVKYKKLVGGGLLKIVNQTVPAALRNLGYDESEIKSVVEYIDKNDTIEGAPGLHDDHLPVFDCAFKAMNGTRSIHHMGHIKMMAATQPFISGAISKTVNMPQDCSADEIYDAYMQSWKLGIKAVAIYRDGSKRTQPLSTASDAQKAEKAEKKESDIRRAARRKLPDERNSITHKFSIAGQEGYFMVGLYEDGSPGEIFIKMSKEGSTISGLMDSFAVAVSMCLQYGVPLRVLVNKFSHTRFEPSGYTTNRDIPIAKSLMDYIFRWFDLKFHPNGDNGHIGKVAAAPAASPETSLFETGSGGGGSGGGGSNGNGSNQNGNVGNAQREVTQMQQDAPPCPDCGALTVRSGACYKCNECGATTGCG